MYRFPEYDKLSELIGNNLIMVCCNANQVYLRFDSKVSISINSERFQIIADNKIFDVQVPIDNLTIFDFLEKKVIDLFLNETRTVFEIVFENKNKIVLTDDDHYESHVLTLKGKDFIV